MSINKSRLYLHVYEGHKWNDTVDTLVKKLKHSGVSDTHIRLIEDVLSNNYEIVLEDRARSQVNNIDENAKLPSQLRSENTQEMERYHYMNQ